MLAKPVLIVLRETTRLIRHRTKDRSYNLPKQPRLRLRQRRLEPRTLRKPLRVRRVDLALHHLGVREFDALHGREDERRRQTIRSTGRHLDHLPSLL